MMKSSKLESFDLDDMPSNQRLARDGLQVILQYRMQDFANLSLPQISIFEDLENICKGKNGRKLGKPDVSWSVFVIYRGNRRLEGENRR